MYEDYSKSKVLAIDIETFDPDLKDKGSGEFRSTPRDFNNGYGYILGISISDENEVAGYYSIGHYDITEDQRSKNIEYLTKVLSLDIPKIGANIMYDISWIENWLQVKVNGELIDIQTAEVLLDENQLHYNLDFIGKKYFGESGGKAKDEINQFCADNDLKGDARKHLWKMPTYLVDAYAIQDVLLPIDIWKIQKKKLIEEDLFALMSMECELLRVLLKMRKSGVRIDTELRDKSVAELKKRVATTYLRMSEQLSFDFNYNSPKQLAVILDTFNIPYPVTDKGNPSVKREHLVKLGDGLLEGFDGKLIKDPIKIKVGADLADLRRADKILKTFLGGSLVKYVTKGDLIHCNFYPTMTEGYGTRSGRFSSANPNLQQIPSPSRDKYYGTMSRAPFIPLDGCWWAKIDYSQIEYRMIAHYARGNGADEIRRKYNEEPNTDYHQYIMDLTGLDRPDAKTLNFGVAYSMGAEKMAKVNGWDLGYCYDLRETYHKNAPFIKATTMAVQRVVKSKGYVRTLLNRRARMTDPNKAYVFYNRLIQGSAADLMKKAMLDIYKSGVLDILTMHLTVHDEVGMSVPKTKEGIEAIFKVKKIMETCVTLTVPIVADLELGENWADVKEVTKEEAYKMLEAL